MGINEGNCSDSRKFVAHNCANGRYQIKSIDFDHSYSPVTHSDSFRTNIFIATIHRLTTRIWDVINEIVCVIPTPYYLECLEKHYPNVSINRDDGSFCIQCMNGIQGTKPSRRKWNRILDAVVTMMKYKKSTIDYAIYINVLSDVTVSYITVSTDDVFNATNNKT